MSAIWLAVCTKCEEAAPCDDRDEAEETIKDHHHSKDDQFVDKILLR